MSRKLSFQRRGGIPRLRTIAFAIGGAVAARFLFPASTPRIRRGRRCAATGLATLEKLWIGGTDQWVLIRSQDRENPIVLFLHGGPGTSELTLNRRKTRELERFFTVVNWDQRGAGKSFGAMRDADSMTIGQFVEDTRELTVHLLRRFEQDRLVLVGHSWGTVVGTLTVSRYPQLYSCYVGIGQQPKMKEGERASYDWTLQQAKRQGHTRAIAALNRMGPPPYRRDWQRNTITQRKYLARFGGEVKGSRTGGMGFVLASLLFSREYTLKDRMNFFRGVFGSMRLLWPQLLDVDLFQTVPKLEVPVVFAEGRHDKEAPSEIAARYFDGLAAPSKALVWFEDSAHMPNWEEPERFFRMMVEKVLPIATRSDRPWAP